MYLINCISLYLCLRGVDGMDVSNLIFPYKNSMFDDLRILQYPMITTGNTLPVYGVSSIALVLFQFHFCYHVPKFLLGCVPVEGMLYCIVVLHSVLKLEF